MADHTQVLWPLFIERRPNGYYYSTDGQRFEGPYDDLKDMVEQDLARELYKHLYTWCEIFLKPPPPTQQ